MENGEFIDYVPAKTSIYRGCSSKPCLMTPEGLHILQGTHFIPFQDHAAFKFRFNGSKCLHNGKLKGQCPLSTQEILWWNVLSSSMQSPPGMSVNNPCYPWANGCCTAWSFGYVQTRSCGYNNVINHPWLEWWTYQKCWWLGDGANGFTHIMNHIRPIYHPEST